MADSHDPLIEPIGAKNKRFRFSVRLFLVFTAVACVLLFVGMWVNKRMEKWSVAMLVGDPGAVTTPNKWPRALKELMEAAEKSGIEVDDLEVHCIQSGWDDEYLWRMKASSKLLDFIKKKYELSETTPDSWSIFTRKERPIMTELQVPSWGLPDLDDCEYFVSKGYRSEEVSDSFEVVHDKAYNLIVVHYYFDF